MQIIFVRHGVSEGHEWMLQHGKGDFDRPLTMEGAQQVQKIAEGLKSTVSRVDCIVASPLVRAQQTAHIIAKEYGIKEVETEPALSHEYAPSDTLSAIARISGVETVICVGHQPNISATISLALSGTSKTIIDMGRGASCGVYFSAAPRTGGGTLLFHFPRKVFL